MKTRSKIDRRKSGSVLVVTLLLAAILVLTLGGYLWWVRTQNVQVAEAQSWNAALAIAEAGIEEGMAQINVSVGNLTSPTNYGPSAALNFGPLAGGIYGPRMNSLPDGSYSVIIVPANPGPTIVATGYTQLPMISQPIQRTVHVTTTTIPLFANAMLARFDITTKGSGMMVDSYDSSDPAHSTNGMYNPATRLATGDVASNQGNINLQNATIYGHLYTSPAGTVSLNNGMVGDLSWQGPGIESGWWTNDFNMDITDMVAPYTNGLQPGLFTGKNGQTNTLTTGNYFVPTSSGVYAMKNQSQYLEVSGNVTLYAQGGVYFPGMVIIDPGATFRLYVGTADTTQPVSATLNQVNTGTGGNAMTFQYFGLPSNTSLNWSGNNEYIGTVFAPEASFTLGGGGTSKSGYDYQGSCVVLSVSMNGHFNFHYDQNLRRAGPMTGFKVSSWKEL